MVKLPAGKVRWRSLARDPRLSGDACKALQLMLVHPERPWTYRLLESAMNVSYGRARRAGLCLQEHGFAVHKVVYDGHNRPFNFWFVADESDAWTEAEMAAHAAERIEINRTILGLERESVATAALRVEQETSTPAMTSVQTESDPSVSGSDQAKPSDHEMLTDGREPLGSTTGGTDDLYPQTPAVDESIVVSAAVAAGPPPGWSPGSSRTMRRARDRGKRLRQKVSRPGTPEVVLSSSEAIGLAHALNLLGYDRLEMAGYLALLLGAGVDGQKLLRDLGSGHKTSKNVAAVMLHRARSRAAVHDPVQVEAVRVWASSERRVHYSLRKAA